MIADFLTLLWQSVGMVVLVSVAVSGLLGGVVASRAEWSLAVGILLSGLLPIVGVVVLFIAATAQGRIGGIARGSAPALVPATEDDDCAAAPRVYGFFDDPPLATADLSTSPAYVAPGSSRVRLTVGAASALPAALLGAALLLPWFTVQPVDALLGNFSGSAARVTTLPLLVSVTGLLVAGALFARCPAGRYAAVAAVLAAPWTIIGIELSLTSDAVGRTTVRLQGLQTAAQVAFSLDKGAYVLLVGGLTSLLWAYVALAVVHRARRRGEGRRAPHE